MLANPGSASEAVEMESRAGLISKREVTGQSADVRCDARQGNGVLWTRTQCWTCA